MSSIQTIDQMADYVIDQMDDKGIEKADIIGHSMGGYIALIFGKEI